MNEKKLYTDILEGPMACCLVNAALPTELNTSPCFSPSRRLSDAWHTAIQSTTGLLKMQAASIRTLCNSKGGPDINHLFLTKEKEICSPS